MVTFLPNVSAIAHKYLRLAALAMTARGKRHLTAADDPLRRRVRLASETFRMRFQPRDIFWRAGLYVHKPEQLQGGEPAPLRHWRAPAEPMRLARASAP